MGWLGASVALAALSLGCERRAEALARFSCRCSFLTDTDDTSELRVEVCARDNASADNEAVGCAQTGAPATVQGCRCDAMSGAQPCKERACQVHEYR